MKYLMLSSCFVRVHFVVKFYDRFHLIRSQDLDMNSLRFRQKARKTLSKIRNHLIAYFFRHGIQ
jgi:hypothetical protein